MSEPAPRCLFVPVSGPFGMGEYARSVAIAQGLAARWPAAQIRFMLSAAAPYAADAPFPSTLLASSPTFHSAAVIDVLTSFRPDVVVFDNAGRSAQLRAAAAVGARVVFISSRPRQRRKAFRLGWMRLIEEHWIAYPRFIAGAPRPLERLKLKLLGRPRLRYLDVIMAHDPAPAAAGVAATASEAYVLMVPGGGTGHPGARDATDVFIAAARGLANAGFDTRALGRAPDADGLGGRLTMIKSVEQAELARLMGGARLVIVNGGSTLLQSLACGRPSLAVPIAGDQHARIGRCVAAGAAVAAPLDAAAIVAAATRLLGDAAACRALAEGARALGLRDGVAVALDALAPWFGAR